MEKILKKVNNGSFNTDCCPPKLRGDLTKWLMEINTGVYVGKVSARIREMLWTRICENLSQGRATMVYSTNNEQGMEFCVHNSAWKPMDFDGIQLLCDQNMHNAEQKREQAGQKFNRC